MRARRALGLILGLLGSGQLACTGSFDEQLSEPPPRPVSAAGGTSGAPADQSSTVTAPPPPVTTTTTETTPPVSQTTEPLPEPPVLTMLPPIEFCDAPTKVLVASCGNGSCHSNNNATIGDFAVDPQRAYNFVDRVSRRHADCGKIIDSSDYSKSLLLTKVTGDFDSPRCGERMPVGSFVITDEQIDCLSSWLQQFQL